MRKILGALAIGLAMAISPAQAANQAPTVMPLSGPSSFSDFLNLKLNPGLQALLTCNWGPTAPANGPGSAATAYQCWADTTTSPVVFKRYDGASWVVFGKLNTTTHLWTPVFQGTDLGTASTINVGTGVAAALNINVGTAGSILVNGGVGAFSSATVTNSGLVKGIDVSQTLTGSTGGNYAANRFRITSDNAASGGGILTNVQMTNTFGGGTVDGGRTGLQVVNIMTAATNAANTFPVYTAATLTVQPQANDNGTGGTPKGHAIAVNTSINAGASATFWESMQSIQADVFVPTGASTKYRAGVTVADEGSQVQGSTWDTAFGVSSLASTVGFKNAILIGDMRGFQPMASTGTLIATTGSVAVAKGIDFSSASFTGNQYTGPGASISSTGTATFATLNSSSLTASSAVATDGSKNLVSVTNTGTGNNVLATAPTISNPLLTNISSGTAGVVKVDASGNLSSSGGYATNMSFMAAGGCGNYVAASTAYIGTSGCGAGAETSVQSAVSAPFTAKNLYVFSQAAPVGAQTYIVTLRKNTADTAVTCTITGAATTCNDTTHTVNFATGDLISMKIVTSATAATSNNIASIVTAAITAP